MTELTANSEVAVSMLAQLLETGEAMHGSALSVFVQNYPQSCLDEALGAPLNIAEQVQNSQYSDVLGLKALREKLAARDATKRNQNFLSAANIAVTQGGTHAIHTLLQTFGRADSDVLLPAPSYSGYRDICQLLKLKYRPYTMDDSGGWLTEELLNSLNASTIMIVNTPHNPSGGQIRTCQLERLVQAARLTGAVVVFDCVYDELVYEGQVPQWNTVFKSEDDFGSCIWMNSFSKNYGLPGVRLGWITGSTKVIRMMEPVIESTVLCLPDFLQRWAATALEKLSGKLAQEMRARRNYLCDKLSGVAGLEFKRPPAGITLMAHMRSGSGMALVQRMLNEHAALFLPGEAYYGGDPQSIRLCFGYSRTAIDKYTAILASALGVRLRVLSGTYAPARAPQPFVGA